jgi:hypothetical protein
MYFGKCPPVFTLFNNFTASAARGRKTIAVWRAASCPCFFRPRGGGAGYVSGLVELAEHLREARVQARHARVASRAQASREPHGSAAAVSRRGGAMQGEALEGKVRSDAAKPA